MDKRKFYGKEFCECVYADSIADGYKWRAMQYGGGGVLWDESISRKFRTLRAAKDWAKRLKLEATGGIYSLTRGW